MNSPLHPVYEALVAEWEAELEETEKKIFQALKRAMPNGVTRRELIFAVFGVTVPELMDINNNTYDRKIRKTIEVMRENLIPIFSSSGEAGYRLDISETSISMMVAEWERRREKYDEKINRGRVLINRIRQVGEGAMPQNLPSKPTQFTLFG